MIYLLHSGSELIEEAINNCKYKDKIVLINPTLNSKILRGIRKAHNMTNLRTKKIWVDYLLKKQQVDNSKLDTVIVFDTPLWIDNIEYIRERFSNAKIIFWFWNIIKDKTKINKIKMNCNSIFIFDENEAKKYQIKYHPQFHWITKTSDDKIKNDIFFVGRNKGRLFILENFYEKCMQEKLTVKYHVVKDKKNDFSEVVNLKSQSMVYEEVIEEVKQSKCILDINQEGQAGLTLRALEALFLKKKLMTNNKDIANYDFYRENNIQFLDENNICIDKEFISSKFQDVDNEIIEKYTVDHWLETLIYSE
ncbi:hypothetical protein [Clostridium sp. KNHs214]|uniref:hypothetical protein n=1 Tax=Clostridium sp. KNHs214 TaxID=1540257 RepID=UPI00068CF036|nr:hypothetical protein [Clostridium sp. KNHs214]